MLRTDQSTAKIQSKTSLDFRELFQKIVQKTVFGHSLRDLHVVEHACVISMYIKLHVTSTIPCTNLKSNQAFALDLCMGPRLELNLDINLVVIILNNLLLDCAYM